MRDQAKIDAANAKINEARNVLAVAQKKFHRVYKAQEKIILAETAKDVMTLAGALTTYVADRIENSAGYKWLSDRCWNGEWKGLGLTQSGYFPATNQYALKLALKRIATQEQLDKLQAVLENEVLPVLKPGGLVDTEKRSFRSKELDQFADAKVLDILASDLSENYNFKLLIRGDGKAEVWDLRRVTWDGACIYSGDLKGALTVVRNNCYYEID